MAEDNKYKKFVDDAEKELKRLEREEKRIAAAKKKYEDDNHDKRKKRYLEYKKQLKDLKSEQDKITTSLKLEKAERKEIDKYNRSLAKLSERVRKEIGISVDKGSVFESISQDIVKEKAKETVLEGEAQSKAARRETIMSSIVGDMETQAKAIEKSLGLDEEREQFAQRRRDIESMSDELSKEEIEKLKDAVNRTEELYNKNQRILELQSKQKDLYNSMPESLKSAITFGQGLFGTLKKAGLAAASFAIIGAVLVSAVKSFTALDSAADKFNDDTKLAISQMGEMQKQAANIVAEFTVLGATATDFYNIQKELLGVFNDTFRVSESVGKSLVVINKNFGVSESAAAKTLQIFENIADVNTETAASLQLQTLALARSNHVAPAAVIEDIAKSSETIYGAFQGNVDELVRSAVVARRLGTEISKIVDTTNKLLNFETSITSELNAAAFVGGQFNLQRARTLRLQGKIGESQEEILRQIQRSGDFRLQNYYTQEALAEASGMTTEEIIKQLNNQDKLNKLGVKQQQIAKEAMDNGLDITNLSTRELETQVELFKLQKEQQGVVANIENSFNSISANLGKTLLPVVEKVAQFFQFISESTAGVVAFTGTLVTLLGTILALKIAALAIDIKSAIAKRKETQMSILGAVASVFKGQGAVPIIGAVLAAAMIGTLFAALAKAKNVGDLASPAGMGRTMVSTREGGLFQTSPNDDVVAAPNLISTLNTISDPPRLPVTQTVNNTQQSNGTDKLIRTIERLEKAYMKGAQVNLDGINVTKRLGRVSDETTKNNFSLV